MTNNKLKIGVLLGGTSNEREVSLSSGLQVVNNLDKEKYDINIYDPKINLRELINDCLNKKIDFCFIALHGKAGEDGSIQGLLDSLNMPYNGSEVTASALCMDKVLSKKILKSHNILTPNDLIIKKSNWLKNKDKIIETISKQTTLPIVIKPSISGSSVGVSIVKNYNKLIDAINESFLHDETTIIEEYINGQEITASILGNEAMPLIEILPGNDFFDYESKYTTGKCQEIVPARINKELETNIKNQALMIANILGCRGLSRVDFIIKDQQIFFLEINKIIQ